MIPVYIPSDCRVSHWGEKPSREPLATLAGKIGRQRGWEAHLGMVSKEPEVGVPNLSSVLSTQTSLLLPGPRIINCYSHLSCPFPRESSPELRSDFLYRSDDSSPCSTASPLSLNFSMSVVVFTIPRSLSLPLVGLEFPSLFLSHSEVTQE